MSQSESSGYGWKAWRIRRLLQILELKAQGLTDHEASLKMPISRATVSRELNSPQASEIGRKLRKRAEGMVWPLVEKQLRQIERDPSVTTPQKLIYRSKLISILATLVPRKIETKQDISVETKEYQIILADVGAKTWEEVLEEQAKEEAEDAPTTDDVDSASSKG